MTQVFLNQCLREAIIFYPYFSYQVNIKSSPPNSNGRCVRLHSQCIPAAETDTEKRLKLGLQSVCLIFAPVPSLGFWLTSAVGAGSVLCACSPSSSTTHLAQLQGQVPSAPLMQKIYFFHFVLKNPTQSINQSFKQTNNQTN